MSFDFDRDAPKLYATDASVQAVRLAGQFSAIRRTISVPFRRRGAKMIVPHGVSDPVFSINDHRRAWYRRSIG